MIKFLPITEERIRSIQSETENDECLQTLKSVILDGWPETQNDLAIELHPYFPHRDELTVQNGLIFIGDYVIKVMP